MALQPRTRPCCRYGNATLRKAGQDKIELDGRKALRPSTREWIEAKCQAARRRAVNFIIIPKQV